MMFAYCSRPFDRDCRPFRRCRDDHRAGAGRVAALGEQRAVIYRRIMSLPLGSGSHRALDTCSKVARVRMTEAGRRALSGQG
jgi:hypothetical protein